MQPPEGPPALTLRSSSSVESKSARFSPELFSTWLAIAPDVMLPMAVSTFMLKLAPNDEPNPPVGCVYMTGMPLLAKLVAPTWMMGCPMLCKCGRFAPAAAIYGTLILMVGAGRPPREARLGMLITGSFCRLDVVSLKFILSALHSRLKFGVMPMLFWSILNGISCNSGPPREFMC